MKNKKLTFKAVKEYLSLFGVTICRTGYGKELKVRIKNSPVGHGYFTTELDDAMATGRHMATANSYENASKTNPDNI